MATEQSGEGKVARLRVGIIAGSTRPGRQSRTGRLATVAPDGTRLGWPGLHAWDMPVEKASQ
jgi:hypothetical protein